MLTVDYDRLGVRPGDKVLDLGCGAGRHTFEALRRHADVVAVDLDRELLGDVGAIAAAMSEQGETRRACLCVKADARSLPFPDSAFDRVVVSEVLEHILDDRRVLAEVARLLKPGGVAAVTVPRWWPERVCWALSSEYHSNNGGHVRIYKEGELRRRLRTAGLDPVHAHHAHALHAPYWWLKCAFGVSRENALVPRLYHRFLVWDLTHNPKPVRVVERSLDPVLGKSLCIYARKAAVPAHV